ncbi:MAG: type II toxin-antitoxin system Phd/YefM family antitoxin [Steroidobacteraceae bacterium]
MKTYGAFEAKNRLSELLARVERGEEIVITRHGHAVARLVPTADFDREAVQSAIDQIKELRSQQTLGDVDLKELVNAGRRY